MVVVGLEEEGERRGGGEEGRPPPPLPLTPIKCAKSAARAGVVVAALIRGRMAAAA